MKSKTNLFLAILPVCQNFFELITLFQFLTSGFAPRGCLTLKVVTRYTMATYSFLLTANVPPSPLAMTFDLVHKVNCLTLARTKRKKEVNINRECILDTIERRENSGLKVVRNSPKSRLQIEEIVFLIARESDKAALEHWLELLPLKNDEILTKARQYLGAKETLSHFEIFKSQISATNSHSSQKYSSIYLFLSVKNI